MKNASITILDEATANVDPENEAELQKAIEALTKGKTIIMIAHRLKTVKNADQILVLEQGKIAQQGTHEELIQQKGIYADFVNIREKASSWKIKSTYVSCDMNNVLFCYINNIKCILLKYDRGLQH